MTFFENRSLFK